MKSTKLAIFDIDKTIIRNDSMFQFVRYTTRRYPGLTWWLPVIAAHTLLFKAGFMSVERVKRSYFKGIECMSEQDLEHFYNSRLQTAVFAEAITEMEKRKQEGYHVLLVTASPHAYMKYFATLPYVDDVIGTELVRHANGNGYTCKIEGMNCKGEEKVRRIQAYLQERSMVIDFDQSCAYSDSLSDLPVMMLVAQRYFINRRVPQMEELSWGK
ncbi:phosphoserine phosphatase [Paenibacillus montaniterrae]|uniref:Phosphoserine phosphatase n=1 Tax=Paenibacillus montaniterrae TaxID=429341 RepID=A0A920D168_9BACL|nr:HAD family hydrolase [Paenibacillus montaniterrae]GIP19268.1 phosphoserine phosphatase [Paenibacillus montaniterrae]